MPLNASSAKPQRRAPARPAGEWSDLYARDLSVLDLGLAASMAVIDQLQELKTFARAATDPDLGVLEREEQQADYLEVIGEMEAALAAARIEGLNLLVNDRLDGPGDTLSNLATAPVLAGDWSLGRPRGSGVSVSARDRLHNPEMALAVLEDVLMSFIWASSEYMRLQRAVDEALEAYGPATARAMKQPPVSDRIRRPADARTARYMAQATQALVGPNLAIANRRPRHLLRLARPPLTQDIAGHLPGRVEKRT